MKQQHLGLDVMYTKSRPTQVRGWFQYAYTPNTGETDPLLRWHHPNHAAGFYADLAQLLCERGVEESEDRVYARPPPEVPHATVKRCHKAARLTSRAARQVWTQHDRQAFAAHWGRVMGIVDALAGRRHPDLLHQIVELVVLAARVLVHQATPDRRLKYLGTARAWVTISEDDVSDTEIRWRIRDWLALSDNVTNIPPRPRLAASAAWRVGARKVAFEIVLDAISQQTAR